MALWSYRPSAGYDELVGTDGRPRPVAAGLSEAALRVGLEGLVDRQRAADEEIRRIGVTYQIGHDASASDRPWPFDVVPRIIDANEWQSIRHGLVQRLRALNLFIDDVYHDQRVIRDGIVPAEVVVGSPNFRPQCVGIDPPGRIWAHICGSDLVRGEDGTFYVLEDNLRVPSGVSYLLENRTVAKRVFPELFRAYSVEPVASLHREACRDVRRSDARRGRVDDGHPHARSAQLGLLRARVPRPTAGSRARRGERPGGRRRRPLHAHHRRTRTG